MAVGPSKKAQPVCISCHKVGVAYMLVSSSEEAWLLLSYINSTSY